MRVEVKGGSKTRSIGHYWSDQRKRNAMNLRKRNLGMRESFDLEADWRLKARRNQIGWREEMTNCSFDDRGWTH